RRRILVEASQVGEVFDHRRVREGGAARQPGGSPSMVLEPAPRAGPPARGALRRRDGTRAATACSRPPAPATTAGAVLRAGWKSPPAVWRLGAEPASALQAASSPAGVSRSGEKPEPTVTVRTGENTSPAPGHRGAGAPSVGPRVPATVADAVH